MRQHLEVTSLLWARRGVQSLGCFALLSCILRMYEHLEKNRRLRASLIFFKKMRFPAFLFLKKIGKSSLDILNQLILNGATLL
jgi:hypothetical protein